MKKKILASLLVLAMIASFAACAKKEVVGENTVNPIVEYGSLEEINEKAQVNLVQPDSLTVSDESFGIISDKIAQYQFTADGIKYTFRASTTLDEDISGVYSGSNLLLDSMDSNGYAADKDGKIANWSVSDENDVQYVLYAADGGKLDEQTFMDLVKELQDGTVGVISDEEAAKLVYEQIAGDYYDETSQRAVATVTNNGDSVSILVSWGSAYNEMTEWSMTATFDFTYGLLYSDCVKQNITLNDKEGASEEVEVVYENGSGYFGIDGQCRLLWLGASEDDCKDCVFVKSN